MYARALRFALAVAALGTAGSASADDSQRLGSVQANIVDGSMDTTDSSVVLVHSVNANETCTGVVIAPRLVLTAAHCVPAGDTYKVGTAQHYDFTTTSPDLAVQEVSISPDYDASVLPPKHDLAVLIMKSDVGTPVPYHAGAPDASWVGQPLRLVGYGKTAEAAEDQNYRRSVTSALGSYTSTDLVITDGKQNCGGDSGGPALMTLDGIETIVGISSAATADCVTDGYYTRLDGDIDFINAEVASSPGGSSVALASDTSAHAQTGGCSATGRAPAPAAVLFGIALLALAFRRRRSAT